MEARISEDDTDRNPRRKPNNKKNGSANMWHLRLDHALPIKAVRSYLDQGLLPHLTCPTVDCDVCKKGKFKRRFSGSLTKSAQPDTLRFDIKEKIETISTNGNGYYVTIVKEHTRFTTVHPIKSKSDASDVVLRYVNCFEKQTGCSVKRVHTDGG